MIQWYQFALVLMILAGGCSGGPKRVQAPEVDPASAAMQALELYDTNHDTKLSLDELAACPGVLVSIKTYDTNGDDAVDAEEFRTRLEQLYKNRTGATQLTCSVTMAGRPLSGAEVVFEPEPYLGGDVRTAKGVTNNAGMAKIGIDPEHAPAALKDRQLIHYGTFKVRVTHPMTSIPPKYNTETTLGYETMRGNPNVSFSLTQ